MVTHIKGYLRFAEKQLVKFVSLLQLHWTKLDQRDTKGTPTVQLRLQVLQAFGVVPEQCQLHGVYVLNITVHNISCG